MRRLREWLRAYPEMRVCVVNLKSGTAFRGLCWRHAGDYVVLRQVELLSDRGEDLTRRAVDGEVAIRRADIDFVQVIG